MRRGCQKSKQSWETMLSECTLHVFYLCQNQLLKSGIQTETTATTRSSCQHIASTCSSLWCRWKQQMDQQSSFLGPIWIGMSIQQLPYLRQVWCSQPPQANLLHLITESSTEVWPTIHKTLGLWSISRTQRNG